MAARLAAPGPRPARPGVVGGSGHGHGAAQVVKGKLQVGRANRDVGVPVIDLVGRKTVHADFFRRPARRGGHDLHQAGCAHAGAGIHDETAFLAYQAVDIGRVEVDGLAAPDHRFPKGHGKALLEIRHGGGALAGVDAAVPDLAVTGELGGSQQFTLAHAALLVQIGCVVPLANAFRTQANRDGVGGAVQAGVAPCGFFFFRSELCRLGWHGDFLTQVFKRKLLVKAAHRSDGLQQGQRFGALRRDHGGRRRALRRDYGGWNVGRRRSQQRTRFPVGPGRVLAGVIAHGIDGLGYQLPVGLAASAQGCARLPGQHVVGQVGVFGNS